MMQKILGQGRAKVKRLLSIIAMVAFIAGYAIAVIAGIVRPDSGGAIATLVVLGLIVGFLNISAGEIQLYLLAAIALVLVGNSDIFKSLNQAAAGLGDKIDDIVRMLAIFTAPAAVVQAIKAGVTLAKPGD